jgi:hypothetical protein
MITLETTEWDLLCGTFVDQYGQTCSIGESSLAFDKAIWLGIQNGRMLLTRSMAADLLPHLQRFVVLGKLGDDLGEQVADDPPLDLLEARAAEMVQRMCPDNCLPTRRMEEDAWTIAALVRAARSAKAVDKP